MRARRRSIGLRCLVYRLAMLLKAGDAGYNSLHRLDSFLSGVVLITSHDSRAVPAYFSILCAADRSVRLPPYPDVALANAAYRWHKGTSNTPSHARQRCKARGSAKNLSGPSFIRPMQSEHRAQRSREICRTCPSGISRTRLNIRARFIHSETCNARLDRRRSTTRARGKLRSPYGLPAFAPPTGGPSFIALIH